MYQETDPTYYLVAGAIWLLFCGLAAILAERFGRSGMIYFFVAALLSPITAFVALLAKGPDTNGLITKLVKIERTHKVCGNCFELVDKRAVKCKHCHSVFLEQEQQEKAA